MKTANYTLILIATALLAACGGGGEDQPDPVSATSPAPAAAVPPAATPPAAAPTEPTAAAPAPVAVVTPPAAAPAPGAAPAPAAPEPYVGPPLYAPLPQPALPPEQTRPPVPMPGGGYGVVRTTMTCSSIDGTGSPWSVDFEVDTSEYPWKGMSAYGQYSGYWEMDPSGDIVNQRGLAAVPHPSPGINGQPLYYATVSSSQSPSEGDPLIQVTIGSVYYQGNYIYTMRRGRMINALRGSTNVVGTDCFSVQPTP